MEGIVIARTPFKERDLIVKLMLRDGRSGSFYIYGGLGGGSKMKPTLAELGNLITLEVRDRRHAHEGRDLQVAHDVAVKWQPQFIRHDYRAFALMCMYLELSSRASITTGPEESDDHHGLFNVLSNGIFHLDRTCQLKQVDVATQLTVFMAKFLHHLGVMPDHEHCVFCGVELNEEVQDGGLVSNEGGFTCRQCMDNGEIATMGPPLTRPAFKAAASTRFQEVETLVPIPAIVSQVLVQFFCHQFHVKLPDLASYKMLF